MNFRLRIALITDVHHSRGDSPPKLCSQALPLLEDALSRLDAQSFDYFVDLGDRIDDRGRDQDIDLAKETALLFARVRSPRAHIMGNHDSYHVSPGEWSEILVCSTVSRSTDVNGYHLVFFSPDVDNKRGRHAYTAGAADLQWLADDLRATELPAIVFTHVPFLAGNMLGNYYFRGTQGRAEFLNAEAIRRILRSSTVTMVIAGHVHWNTWHCVDGIHYVTVQSLSESFTTHPSAARAHSILQVDDAINLSVNGNDAMTLRLLPRPTGKQWLSPQ